jgi:hypothetical protein
VEVAADDEAAADGEVLSLAGVVEAWLSAAGWMMTGVSPLISMTGGVVGEVEADEFCVTDSGRDDVAVGLG